MPEPKVEIQRNTDLCNKAVYNYEDSMYNNFGINFSSLSHLSSIGLIDFNKLGFLRKGNFQAFKIHYYGEPFVVEFEKNQLNEFKVGDISMTQIGQQLATICDSEPVDEFTDYVIEKWVKEQKLKVWSPFPRIENQITPQNAP